MHTPHLHLATSTVSSIKLRLYPLLASHARSARPQGQSDGPQRDGCSCHLDHWLGSILGGLLPGWQSSCSRML
ncbi:hypothetical protein RSOLAG1IB_09043 [Rhizoctonia solani AG-1 IB]|uniref:Uncharacterized protein n=1 Tax=Thanatephorus cucumeris (strain AG1-IB / isolate 7/3/14) TaxID=1108050 RepID=A0A0B7FMA6_THACB|nr:hypothetical protein RSOLAG1IB_09043 [Rhizoctonia solani AG-1 IB]